MGHGLVANRVWGNGRNRLLSGLTCFGRSLFVQLWFLINSSYLCYLAFDVPLSFLTVTKMTLLRNSREVVWGRARICNSQDHYTPIMHWLESVYLFYLHFCCLWIACALEGHLMCRYSHRRSIRHPLPTHELHQFTVWRRQFYTLSSGGHRGVLAGIVSSDSYHVHEGTCFETASKK